MEFEPGHLYHVYNRGNNSQKIFFTPANYLFFLKKIKVNILPYADILAWCLMPNHFHLMIHVNEPVAPEPVTPQLVTPGHLLSKTPGQKFTEQVTQNSHQLRRHQLGGSLNVSIGNLLSSYTRAIQRQENRTGSLFQHRSKARCLTRMEGISPVWFQSGCGPVICVDFPEKEYPQVCFDYIHGNPVKDGWVKEAEEWEFSSARDYAGLRNGKLINRQRAKEFGLAY